MPDLLTPTPPATPPATSPATPLATSPVEFKVPEAYAKEPWAAEIKSVDDLWKRTSELQVLAGKKGYVPPAESDPPEKKREFLSKIFKEVFKAPDSAKGYKFVNYDGDVNRKRDEKADQFFANMFFKMNIPVDMASEMVKEYETYVAGVVKEMQEQDIAKQKAYTDLVTKMYGANMPNVIVKAQEVLKKIVPPALTDKLDTLDANGLALVVAITDYMASKYTGEGMFGKLGEGAGAGAETIDDLNKQLMEIVKLPDFSNPSLPRYKELQVKSDELSKRIFEFRKKK
jgi:hypothetical protein